jgi:hypothetical protein
MSQRKGAMAAVTSSKHEEEMMELRRGPWTLEEDNLLMNYIACHGEGRWNLLARCSGELFVDFFPSMHTLVPFLSYYLHLLAIICS